jgi:hypothetical protein
MGTQHEPPDPEAMKRPADVKERPADLLARIGNRYGPEALALCRMLATMNERDWARMFNLIRDTTRERLTKVEDDIIRHAYHARPDKAEQLGQFRVLYARLIDIAGAAHGIVSNFAGDGPAERVNLFVDLFSAVCAMIGNPGVAPDVPQGLQRSGVSGVWPNAQPGRPVELPGDALAEGTAGNAGTPAHQAATAGAMPAGYTVTPAGEPAGGKAFRKWAEVPPLKTDKFNPRFHNRDTFAGPVQVRAPHGYAVCCSRCGTAQDLSGEPLPVSGFQCRDCGAYVDCNKRPVDPPTVGGVVAAVMDALPTGSAEDGGFTPEPEPPRSDKSASPYAGGFPPGAALT